MRRVLTSRIARVVASLSVAAVLLKLSADMYLDANFRTEIRHAAVLGRGDKLLMSVNSPRGDGGRLVLIDTASGRVLWEKRTGAAIVKMCVTDDESQVAVITRPTFYPAREHSSGGFSGIASSGNRAVAVAGAANDVIFMDVAAGGQVARYSLGKQINSLSHDARRSGWLLTSDREIMLARGGGSSGGGVETLKTMAAEDAGAAAEDAGDRFEGAIISGGGGKGRLLVGTYHAAEGVGKIEAFSEGDPNRAVQTFTVPGRFEFAAEGVLGGDGAGHVLVCLPDNDTIELWRLNSDAAASSTDASATAARPVLVRRRQGFDPRYAGRAATGGAAGGDFYVLTRTAGWQSDRRTLTAWGGDRYEPAECRMPEGYSGHYSGKYLIATRRDKALRRLRISITIPGEGAAGKSRSFEYRLPPDDME